MRRILFILAVLTGICMAFSDELRNKTALTIKTSDPFSNSIICGNIDSVTFSKTALDGSVHDSVVTKMIHTHDSVFTYALDSIQSVTLDDVSEYIEIEDNFSNLSDYLTETDSKGDSYEEVMKKVDMWLGTQPEVKEWTLLNNGLGFEIKYNNGYSGIIYFLYKTENTGAAQSLKIELPTSIDSKPVCYNVTSVPGETIMYNNKIMCFKGCDDILLSLSIGAEALGEEANAYQEILDKSPINAIIHSNKNIGDLNFLINELPKSDMAIITHTHGEETEGRFITSGASYNLKYLKYLSPCLFLLFNDDVLQEWHRLNGAVWVSPKLLNVYKSGNGVGVLNYCWSNKFREYVLHNYKKDEQKNFIGYNPKTKAVYNTFRVKGYLAYMSNGYTHSNAVKEINSNKELYDDDALFEYDNECHARFFSIENLGTTVDPLGDCCWIKYKIKGWKNLKKDINKLKIWYKGESFEYPDEQCSTIEYDLRRMFYSGCNIGPCTLGEGDRISFNNEGPDFFVYLRLNGIDADSLYYTLGFEHESQDVRNLYHTDVVAVGGITPGVTSGQCIDMGLPSETKWAAWNVGASKPQEYGGSYGWGEPTGTYTEVPYSSPVAGGYDNYAEVVSHYGGENPASDISGSKYDIAHVKWGNGWCLPSVEQWNELMNEEYTLWQHYSLFGVSGIRIISKINGNKLFIPVEFGTLSSGVGSSKFWTGELDETSDNKYSAKTAYVSRYFDSDISKKAGSSERRWSLIHVRPVKK